MEIKKGCRWTVWSLCPEQKREKKKKTLRDKKTNHFIMSDKHVLHFSKPLLLIIHLPLTKKAQRGCVAMTTGVPPCVPVSMLVSAKLSGYLLSLLLASVLFFAGSESLSQSQILLLLRADAQTATHYNTHRLTLRLHYNLGKKHGLICSENTMTHVNRGRK